MMRFLLTRRTVLAAFGAGVAAAAISPAFAAAPAAKLDQRDRADVQRIEAYLNAIRTLRGRFIQTASTGGFAEGTIAIKRPGKMRLDYAPPNRLQVYATGFWLIYVDHELQNVSQVPLSTTPAAVLVDEKVTLSGGDITVTRVERGPQMIRLHLIQTREPDAGRLVFAFSDAPLQLRDWTVIDPQGVETRVALVNPEINVPIDNRVFFFDPPPWATVREVPE